MKKYKSGLIALAFALACNSMVASTIDILWYVTPSTPGGTDNASYKAAVNALVAQEQNPLFNISGSVNTWNVTFWDGSGPSAMPAGSYDVIVGGSGNSSSLSNYTELNAFVGAGSFGSRVMLTGQDADFHYINGPGPGSFNGPAGFLINSINWAASGTGMGAVLLGLDASRSMIFPGVSVVTNHEDDVFIPGAYASFPLNIGLTSAGLSNWGNSSHDRFTVTDSSLWTAINVEGGGNAITIVSALEAGGGTTVPDSGSSLMLLGLGLSALAVARRRKAA